MASKNVKFKMKKKIVFISQNKRKKGKNGIILKLNKMSMNKSNIPLRSWNCLRMLLGKIRKRYIRCFVFVIKSLEIFFVFLHQGEGKYNTQAVDIITMHLKH